MSNIRWNKQPNNEWLHGIFLPANAGFSVAAITIPAGFIAYNGGCVGTCPSGSGANGGPGFYFDNTFSNACCGTISANDGNPCNNYGNTNISCSSPISLTFDLTFCNSAITSSSYEFVLTGSSDGETGCYNINDGNTHQIKFSISSTPCIVAPLSLAATPVKRTCTGSSVNYTSTLTGNCTGNTIYWWDAASGGNLLGTGSPFVYDPAGSACPAGTTLYATCCSGISTNCVDRQAITISGLCNQIAISGASFLDQTCINLGSIDTLFVQHAQGAITYTLHPGSITSSSPVFAGLPAGNYTVSAKDSTLCEAFMIITIASPPLLNWISATSSSSLCNSGTTASINCLATGGSASITYTLNPGAINNTSGVFSGLAAGVYTVTASGSVGCTISTIITIINPSALSWNSITTSNPTCTMLSTGNIQLQAIGGTGSLQYTLSPGGLMNTTGNFVGLSAGNYSIQVSDANGCTLTTLISLINPDPVTIISTSITQPLCNNSSTGSITVGASGGTGAFMYTLLPSVATNGTGIFLSLSAGNYTVQIVDGNNCSVSTTIALLNPNTISWNAFSTTLVTCNNGNDGAIQTSANGGTGTLTYTLQPTLSTNTSGNFTSLVAGVYTLVATDANGCTLSSIATITQPTPIIFGATNISPITCINAANASISIGASGGSGTLTYTLQPVALSNSTGIFSGLGASNYTITVSDILNCSVSTVLSVTQPTNLLWISIQSNSITCNNASDGMIQASASGGTGSILYQLQPSGISNSSGTFSSLSPGNYTIQASDANGCSISTILSITQPPLLQLNSVSTSIPTCIPGNDGSILINASGGTPSYQFSIGGIFQSGSSFINLGSGTYTIVVRDANLCTSSSIVIISSPINPTITSAQTSNESCNPGNDGTISIVASNGSLPYQYSSNGILFQAASVLNGLAASTYTIVVRDNNGCTVSSIVTINGVSSPIIDSVQTTQASCIPGCDASIQLFVSSGALGTYQYSIDGINFQSSALFTNVCAATYTLLVQDANGCIDTQVTSISTGIGPTLQITNVTHVSCAGFNTGSLTALGTGGTLPYTYTILPTGLTNTTGVFTSLAANTYTILVVDNFQCTNSIVITITEPPILQFNNIQSISVNCWGASNGSISASVIGGSGAYTFTILPTASFVAPNNFIGLTGNTTYTISVSDANTCSISTQVFVGSPSQMQINNVVIQAVSCFGTSTGNINYSASGGTGTFQYTLLPSGFINTSGNFTNLNAGNYTLIAVDANGCSASSLATITQAPAIQINSIQLTNNSCTNINDGSISITASGGTGLLNYMLQPIGLSNTTGLFTGLIGATYTITIQDINNCIKDTIVQLINPTALVFTTVTTSNVICFGDSNGSAQISTSGGTGLYTYTLLPVGISNTTGNFTNLYAGSYTVVVSDANNCTNTTLFSITQASTISIAIVNQQNITCFGGNNGSIQVSGSGGLLPYVYTMLPLGTQNASGIFTNLSTGIVSVQVQDANGCSSTSTPIILSQGAPIIWNNSTLQSVTCFGDTNGSIQISANGGSGSLNYSLLPNFGTQIIPGNFSNLPSGMYTVTATDANLCTAITIVSISQPSGITFDSILVQAPTCFGDKNGSIELQLSGGSLPYTYQLDGGLPATNPIFLNLEGGIFTLTVTDANGCKKDSLVSLITPALLSLSSFSIQDELCENANNAILNIQAFGGSGTFTYTLRPDSLVNTTGIFTDLTPGSYSIHILDSLGCSFDTSVQILPLQNPLQLSINKQDLGCIGKPDQGWAEAIVTGGTSPYSYQWNTSPIQYSARADGLVFGWYIVQVSDANECTLKDTTFIEPGPCCEEMYIPNAFSPNGDGINDVFRVLTTAGIDLKQFEIFDRWGKSVWKTAKYNDAWDGTYTGSTTTSQTFFYIYRYRCITDGKTYMRSGDILLIR
jgi:gliding motility-associated-like protein